MKVSIITPVFNNEKTIQYNLASVANQSYKNYEHIIIYMNSNDKSLSIIEDFPYLVHLVKFESNYFNYYLALNKGIEISTGDIICFLDANSYLSNVNTLGDIVAKFNENNFDAIIGSVVYLDNKNLYKIKKVYNPIGFSDNWFHYGGHVPHSALVAKRSLFKNYGNFKIEFFHFADYEIAIRLFLKFNVKKFVTNDIYFYKFDIKERINFIPNKRSINYYYKYAWNVNSKNYNISPVHYCGMNVDYNPKFDNTL